MREYLIEYRNVTVKRDENVALDRVSFAIGLGEHVAILGPNGSGKSSLIKTITRECYPLRTPEASLQILGRNRWHVFELRAMLGIVTNDLVAACTCAFPVHETVLSGFFSSVGLWPYHTVTPEMERRAGEAMELLEITHLASRPMMELSSGEARRAVIARALIHRPKALVLDEPTTSLDLRATHELREIMRKIAQAGTTIVLVTHHLPDIIPEIGRVILLKQGRVFRDGPKTELLASASLTELFEWPVEVGERDGYYYCW